MAKHYTTTVQAVHKEIRFIPDCCPCRELLETLLGSHQCLRGEAAAIVHPMPRGPRAAAVQSKCCPFCRVPSVTPEGWTDGNVIVDIPGVSQPPGLLPCGFLGPAAGRARVEPAPQLLVASDPTFIIKVGPLAACVGISVRSSTWTRSFEASQLHPIISTGRVCPSCAATLQNEAGWSQPSWAWPPRRTRGQGPCTPSPSGTSQRCERVKPCC